MGNPFTRICVATHCASLKGGGSTSGSREPRCVVTSARTQADANTSIKPIHLLMALDAGGCRRAAHRLCTGEARAHVHTVPLRIARGLVPPPKRPTREPAVPRTR